MKLQDLKIRAFDILGDDPADARWFDADTLVTYMNRGCLIFRREVGDEWYRVDIPVVANQAIYDFPLDNVRVERMAFDDRYMEPTSVTSLQGRDPRWEATDSVQPFMWTSDGLLHTQFRIWPKPTTSSPNEVLWSAGTGGADGEHGVVVRVLRDSVAMTNVVDASNPLHTNPEHGLTVSISGYSTSTDVGEVVSAVTSGGGLLTLWLVERPAPMTDDQDEVPVGQAWQLAPLWYAMQQTYLEEADHHNSVLASFYGDLFRQYIVRAKLRYSNPSPRQIHRLQGRSYTAGRPSDGLRFSPTVLINGVPVTVRWPRGV